MVGAPQLPASTSVTQLGRLHTAVFTTWRQPSVPPARHSCSDTQLYSSTLHTVVRHEPLSTAHWPQASPCPLPAVTTHPCAAHSQAHMSSSGGISTHLHSGRRLILWLGRLRKCPSDSPSSQSNRNRQDPNTHLHSGHRLLLCLGCLSVRLGIPFLLCLLGEGLLLLSHVLGQVSLLLLDALAQMVPATAARVVYQRTALASCPSALSACFWYRPRRGVNCRTSQGTLVL